MSERDEVRADAETDEASPAAGGPAAVSPSAQEGDAPAAVRHDARGKAKPSPFATWKRGSTGPLDLLKHSELRYSTDGLEFIRTIVRILVIAMFICAIAATYVMKRYVAGNSPAGTFIIVFCWSMPIIIYCPLSVIFHIRKSYLVRVENGRLIYRRYFIRTEIPLSEIDDALDTKPVIRDRNGVWIPKRHGRILLSEIDTLPGLLHRAALLVPPLPPPGGAGSLGEEHDILARCHTPTPDFQRVRLHGLHLPGAQRLAPWDQDRAHPGRGRDPLHLVREHRHTEHALREEEG